MSDKQHDKDRRTLADLAPEAAAAILVRQANNLVFEANRIMSTAAVNRGWKDKPDPSAARYFTLRDSIGRAEIRLDRLVEDMAGESRVRRGVELIEVERARQEEEWTAEHDASHVGGELAIRAAELAAHGTDASVDDSGDREPDAWELVRKHGHDRVRSLTIAGALIAAEIDRLLAAREGGEQ